MRIVALEHERESPAGLFAEWAETRGHRLEVLDVPALTAWPSPAEHDLVLSLGSDCSVHASSDPWIAAEIAYLRAARAAAVPMLGICFGAQILAAALGGSVRRAARPDASWQEVAASDPTLIPPGPWLCWHDDVLVVPEGADELARDDLGPLAFRDGADLGLQFHPEVDAELAATWLAGARERLTDHRLDETTLRAQTSRNVVGARERAFDLFDRLAPLWLEQDDARRR